MTNPVFRYCLPLFLLCLAIAGCSTEPEPTVDPNALLLRGSGTRQGNVAFFNLSVTRNQQPIKGAKLVRRTSPTTTIDTIGVRSDSTGKMEFAMVLNDSVTRYALYAVKDSLVSNTLLWP